MKFSSWRSKILEAKKDFMKKKDILSEQSYLELFPKINLMKNVNYC